MNDSNKVTVTGATTISDTGIVNFDNSAVDMDSLAITNGGSLNAATGTTLTVTGATTISGAGVVNLDNSAANMASLAVTGGGSLNATTGTTLMTGATTISDAGSVNLDGGSSAYIDATLTMDGGDLNIGKTNANTATVTVSNIVADSDSKIIVTAGSSLNVGGGITGNNPAIAMTGDSSFDITGTGKTETNASLSTNGKDINLAGNSTGKVTDALVDMDYTGTMNVTENGSLTLDNTTVLGSVSATGDNANLTLSNVDIKKKPGTGTGPEVGGNLTVTNNANLTLTGTNVAEGKVDITGADLTITNGGTLTTDGDNDIIDVNGGGTINIGGGTGTPGGVTGGTVNSDINVNGGGTVNLDTGAQSTGDILYTGTTGTSLVNVNDDFNLGKDHHVIVNNAGGTNEMAIDANKSFTLDGQMAGDGDLNLTGEGSLVLNADNSQDVTGHGIDHQSHGNIEGGFTGDLNMTGGGTIVLNNNEAMGNVGTLNVTAKDATLKTGATDVSSSKDINVQDVDLNIATTGDLTLTDLATVTVDGYGAIVKTGAGELTLDSSDVNIEGILQINEGTVNLNNIDANPNLTTGNDIDQIVVNAGTLNITGSVIDGTDITLTDDQSIANLANSTLNLDLKGESGVANINDAAVTINGDIIFEGTTSDDKQMTINVNDNFTFGGNGYDINVNDNGTINVATDKVMILNGNLVGKDTNLDLTKDGNGKLVINTDNTDYEGNIKLTAGSIDVGNDTNALGTGILKVTGDSALNILASTTVGGALVQLNNGITMMGNHTLTLDTANETNLHDSILIGTEGSIVKTGAERLILTNIDGDDMTGTALNVKEGKLLLDNTNMGNKITMSDKTVLEGDQSTVANLKGESGSSIHLGMDKTKDVGHENGYGQLTVTDTMDMTSGSNFYLDIDGASIKSDSIKATHANLKGATVVLNDRGTKGVGKGAWTNEQRYTIVETGDIQSGFDWHVDGLYYLNAHLENTANGVDVVMTQNYKSAAGRTPNQLSIANAVETIENSGKATGALTDMLAAFEHTQSKEEAKQALESVGNIGLTTQMSQQLESNLNHLRLLRSAIGSAMPAVIPSATNMDQKGNLIKPMFDGRNQAWGQATGGTTKLAGDGNGSGYDMNTWGAAIGYERAFTRSFTAGLAFSYENAHIMTKNPYVGNSSYDSDDYYIDLYAKWQKGAWQMNGSLGFSCMDYDMDRSVNVAGGTPAGFNRGATGSTTGMGLNLSYELSYDIVLNKTTMVQPLFTIESSANKIDGYTEGGNIGNAGLVVDDQDAWMTVVGLGGRFIKDFTLLPNAPQARFQFRALMTASVGDQASTVDASFKGAPGTMFRMNGSDPQRLGGLIGADLTVPVSTRTAVFMGSSYEVKGSDHNIMGNVGVRMTF
ncbi:MAG: autotransporter domain-containing protein [Akkermansia sp.]